MTKTIGQAMRRHPVSDEQLRLRDELAAELLSKQELTRELRRQLALREAYLLGMMEGNPSTAPSAEMLESLVS